MSTMTLEQVRDELRKLAHNPPKNVWRQMFNLADAIDAHLAKPAKAVDVEAILELACQFKNDEFGVDEFQEKLTRALSGEKADALLRECNAVALKRGDKYGLCDAIDNDGQPYQSAHLAAHLGATP